MYKRSPVVWTAFAVLGSAILTLLPQALWFLQTGTEGDPMVRMILGLLLMHLACLLSPWVWWQWRGRVLDGWRIRRRYDRHVYRPPRRSLGWYAGTIILSLASVVIQQFSVTVLIQLGKPLSIATLANRAAPFLLTLWDVRRSKWFPVIGIVQLVGAVIAMELFLIAFAPDGWVRPISGSLIALEIALVTMWYKNMRLLSVSVNPEMTSIYPAVAVVLALIPLCIVGLRVVDRRIFKEEHRQFTQRQEVQNTTAEEASFLTAKLLTLSHASLTVLYVVCFVVAGAVRGFPSWRMDNLAAAAVLFALCGFASAILVASSIHGRMALFAAGSASTLGCAYAWNWLFQGTPATLEQVLGSLIVVWGVVAATLVEMRAARTKKLVQAVPEPLA